MHNYTIERSGMTVNLIYNECKYLIISKGVDAILMMIDIITK